MLLYTVYGGRGIGTWNEVDDDDDGEGPSTSKEAPVADKEMAFMDEEPSADQGIAGALQLAMKKGRSRYFWNVVRFWSTYLELIQGFVFS